MSQENAELVRSANAAFNAADWERFGEHFHPGVVYEDRPGMTLDVPTELRGRDEFLAAAQRNVEVFDQFHRQLLRVQATDEQVAVLAKWRGVGRVSSVPVELQEATVWTLKDGQFIRGQVFETWEQALEAVGLSG